MAQGRDRPEATVIIRVWFEDHPAYPLRAVVFTVGEAESERPRAAKTMAEICAAVNDELASLTRTSRSADRLP